MSARTPQRTLTEPEWFALGQELFGPDVLAWRFVCPACGHVQTPADFKGNVPKGTSADVAFVNCIGRYLPTAPRDAFKDGPGPCNYAGGGLFDLRPWTVTRGEAVKSLRVFAFADPAGAACTQGVATEAASTEPRADSAPRREW